MQTDTILQLFTPYIQREIARLSEELSKTWDFRQFEKDVMKLMNQLEACLITCVLEEHLTDPTVLMQLKLLAGKLGMRFKEYGTIRVRLCSGMQLVITTPYFLKAKPKRGRKKEAQMDGASTWDWRFWAFWDGQALAF